MKVASLFTGAGGLDLGLQQAGHEIILQCESDPGAQQVLSTHFLGKVLVPDVRFLLALPEETELLVAGIPCIDVSAAGHREGASGKKTGIGRHVFRLLRTAARNNHPVPWLLLENVEAFLNRHDQQGDGGEAVIACIVKAVEDLGYRSWAYRIVNTAGFGVPHQRRRMLFLASMHGDARDLLLATGMRPCTGGCEERFGQGKMCYRCLRAEEAPVDTTSYALDMGNARNAGVPDMIPTMTRSNQRILLLLSDGSAGLLRLADAERLQGFPEGWTEPCWPVEGPATVMPDRPHTAANGADDAASKRARYALLGNAVSVCMARWIGCQLMEPYRHKYVGHPQDRPMDAVAAAYAEDFGMEDELNDLEQDGADCEWKGHALRNQDAAKQSDKEKTSAKASGNGSSNGGGSGTKDMQISAWPRAAWFVKGLGRWAAGHLSDAPELTPLTPLGDFITQPGKPPSEEALRIYVMRLREGGFQVENLLYKLRQCNLSAGSQAARVVLSNAHTAANIASSPAKAAVAAKRAAKIGQQGRCSKCLTCTQQRLGGNRRCLQLRAAAAAAGGHAGGQIAIMKEAAIGKRLAVWWADDEDWYEGVVKQFDAFRWSHTVEYDDGDTEVLSLWAPHEMVQLRRGTRGGPPLQRRASKRCRVPTEKARTAGEAAAGGVETPDCDTPPQPKMAGRGRKKGQPAAEADGDGDVTPLGMPPKRAGKEAGKERKKGVAEPPKVNRVREAAAALAAADGGVGSS